MENNEFRKNVYKKYDYYKNKKNDDFFNKNQYKGKSAFFILSRAVCLILICALMTGIVYSASYYIKSIWKEPKKYIYEEEKKVTEKDEKESITAEKAKEIGINKIKKLNIETGNIKNSYLNKEPRDNKTEWVIETDNDLEIRINSKTGELYSFSNNKLLNSVYNSKFGRNEAKKIANEIYSKLKYEENYELSYISDIGNGKWQADFSINYNGIFNPYQCVRITFIPETKELVMLNLFDYEFENNPFEITEDEAVKIVKTKYGEEKIKEITAKRDIKKMNTIVYQKENLPSTGEYSYRTEDVVRNVWNVKITERQYGFVEYYYIDATTGEIIGGDQLK